MCDGSRASTLAVPAPGQAGSIAVFCALPFFSDFRPQGFRAAEKYQPWDRRRLFLARTHAFLWSLNRLFGFPFLARLTMLTVPHS